jgi:WD40 repeat protein
VSFSPHVPNMLATCSLDEHIKIWDIANNNGTEPKMIGHKKTTMGELFSLSFYKDIPWVLAAGGSRGEIAIWDTEESEKISSHFSPFLDKSKLPEENYDDEPEE